MGKLFGILALFLFLGSTASAAQKLTLTLERKSALGVEQISLQVEGSVVRYIANTNYWQSIKSSVIPLGVLETESDAALAEKIKDLAFTKKPWKESKKSYAHSPHRTKVLVNGEEAPYGGSLHNSVFKLVSSTIPIEPKWRAVDAIAVERTKSGDFRIPASRKDSQIDCGNLEAPRVTCRVKKYGQIHR